MQERSFEEQERQRRKLIAREELRLKMLEYFAIHEGPGSFEYWADQIEECQERIIRIQLKRF